MAFDDCSKAKAWESHYSNLLNVEFPWNDENLPNELAVHGPPILITEDMICKAISQMKKRKGCWPFRSSIRDDNILKRTYCTTSDETCKLHYLLRKNP